MLGASSEDSSTLARNHLNNAPRVNSKKRPDLKFHPIP